MGIILGGDSCGDYNTLGVTLATPGSAGSASHGSLGTRKEGPVEDCGQGERFEAFVVVVYKPDSRLFRGWASLLKVGHGGGNSISHVTLGSPVQVRSRSHPCTTSLGRYVYGSPGFREGRPIVDCGEAEAFRR